MNEGSTISNPTHDLNIGKATTELRTGAILYRRSRAAERIELLDRLRSALLRHKKELIQALEADFNKPAAETLLSEFLPLLQEIAQTRRHIKKWMKPRRARGNLAFIGTKSYVQPVPKGTILIISPWNYPVLLSLAPLVGALAAGNTVALKPSEMCPHTAQFIQTVLHEIFPRNLVQVFLGDADVAKKLLAEKWDHIHFTGSTRVGREIYASAAPRLTSVTLELGGKSPAILTTSADLRYAAENIAWAKFLNAGQTCVAPDYVLVPETHEKEFIAHLTAAIRNAYGPTSEDHTQSPDLASIISERHVDRLARLVEDSVQQGATIALGGHWVRARRRFSPTILTGVQMDHPVMQEEVFGPVLPVLTYTYLNEVVERLGLLPTPLALYIYGRDTGEVESLLASTRSGGCSVNEALMHSVHPHLPFGGSGESGIGHYHGQFGFESFSNLRSVLKRTGFAFGMRMFYPPYHRKKQERLETSLSLSHHL